MKTLSEYNEDILLAGVMCDSCRVQMKYVKGLNAPHRTVQCPECGITGRKADAVNPEGWAVSRSF